MKDKIIVRGVGHIAIFKTLNTAIVYFDKQPTLKQLKMITARITDEFKDYKINFIIDGLIKNN